MHKGMRKERGEIMHLSSAIRPSGTYSCVCGQQALMQARETHSMPFTQFGGHNKLDSLELENPEHHVINKGKDDVLFCGSLL